MKKILLFDLECTPDTMAVYGGKLYEMNALEVLNEGQLLCFAYKWLGETKTHFESIQNQSLPELVKKLWELLDECDIEISHNGNNFDIRMAYKYFHECNLPPPSPFQQIDTKNLWKKYSRENSNSLKYLTNKYCPEYHKIEVPMYQLTKDCLAFDKKAWKLMKEYNIRDVEGMEQLYLIIRPWVKSHPDTGERGSCHNCGKSNLNSHGTYNTRSGIMRRWECMDCGRKFSAREGKV